MRLTAGTRRNPDKKIVKASKYAVRKIIHVKKGSGRSGWAARRIQYGYTV